MKKLLALVLSALMVFGMISAASAEPVEITFWHSWGSGSNYEAIQELVAKFNAEHEGEIVVTEEYIGAYAELLSKFNVSYSAGENPVVSVIDACMSINEARRNTMTNLTEYAAANDPEYDIGQFIPAMLVFSTDTDGSVWSLPYARSTQIMYCNMDLIEQAIGEAKMPDTWDDVWAISKAYYEQTGLPAYGHSIGGGFFSWYIATMGYGEYYNKAGTGACMYLNNAWEKALTDWRTAIDNGWYEIPSLTTGGSWEDFVAGNLPICFASTGSLTNAIEKTKGIFNLGVGYMVGGAQEDGTVFRRIFTGGANLMLANNKTEEETKAGWEFIKFMTSYDTNIYHSFKTGYVLSHVGAEENEEVQAAWAATPEFKIAYDQLAYVNELYVSAYTSEIDLEVVDVLTAFVEDGVSVADTMDALKNVMESIFPEGVVDTYE